MNKSKRIGSALIVVGGSIAAAPSVALELGDITVHSSIGQPLRASIAYALAPNEAITDTCVSLLPVQAGGAPTIGSSSVSIADGRIVISNGPVIREPLVSFRLNVRCNYTSRLARDYTLFVDPPTRVAPGAAASPAMVARPATATTPRSVPARQVVNRDPIAAGSRYLVQSGDSLSLIAQRAASAQSGWRELSDAIFQANPDAFVGNDPNRLMAGSWLDIPGVDGIAVTTPAQPTVSASEPAAETRPEPAITGTVYAPEIVREPARNPAPEPVLLDEIPEPLALKPRKELRPGDLIFDTTPATPAAPADEAETPAATARDTITIIRQPAGRESQGGNWLLWSAGGAIAFLLGLVLIGRRFFGWFGSKPVEPAPLQQLDDEPDTQHAEALGDVDIDFGDGPLIADDSPTAENPQLDADLIAGTGLSESDDVDLATDFAFAATSNVDIELTEDMAADHEEPGTDIIPPIHADDSSILKGEILPDDEEEDYDISVVLDATKMPDPTDVTERDLEAIAVSGDDEDETLISDDYTLSQEADYKILEQDYQDEMTATEALNAELKKAAEDIAHDLGMADATLNKSDTEAHTTVQDLEITAQMPANDDNSVTDDETDLDPTIKTNAAGDS